MNGPKYIGRTHVKMKATKSDSAISSLEPSLNEKKIKEIKDLIDGTDLEDDIIGEGDAPNDMATSLFGGDFLENRDKSWDEYDQATCDSLKSDSDLRRAEEEEGNSF